MELNAQKFAQGKYTGNDEDLDGLWLKVKIPQIGSILLREGGKGSKIEFENILPRQGSRSGFPA